MNSKAVECPLCFKNFSICNIEKHVQSCGIAIKVSGQSREDTCSLKRKSDANEKPCDGKKRSSLTLGSSRKKVISDNDTHTRLPEQSEVKNMALDSDINASVSQPTVTPKISFPKPLYDMARPTNLKDYVGQTEIVGNDKILHGLLEENIVPSMILWGPPGCGKSTLAHIIANNVRQRNDKTKDKILFVKLSATDSGKADLQAAVKTAANKQRMFSCKTILFIDEIHRFNKLQQDSLLPSVENGTITLLGATTENPSFVLNSALTSRCRVIVLKKLEVSHVKSLLLKTLSTFLPHVIMISSPSDKNSSNIISERMYIEESAVDLLAGLCDGDARSALIGLQTAVETVQISNTQNTITPVIVKECLQRSHYLYDRKGDQHYDLISALHKSIRGGDDNAALYWLTRMILGGEDPKFISRRLIRMASEDIGLADPSAMNQAVSCYQACMFVGMPECDVSLAQCVVYLARAPKSVEVYKALGKVKQCINEHVGPLPLVPLHLRNAPTKLLKDLGCGRDYKYTPEDPSEQAFMPDQLADVNFFSS